MPRPNYCTALDVLRRFDPELEQAELNAQGEFIGTDSEEQVIARIEGVENRFESETGTAFREVRVGSQGDQATWEKLPAKRGGRMPVVYTLDHRNVHPIDSASGDAVEVRTGKDAYDDITSDSGSRFKLVDPRNGKLEFYSRFRQTVALRIRPGVDGFIRLTYRYGGLGGSPTEGGQTTLGATLSTGGTPDSLSVTDASRLPNEGGTMLIDGTEYVQVDSVDAANDTVSIAARGIRRTPDTERSNGEVIHYCPMQVREAIAAEAAREVVLYNDVVDRFIETNEDPTASDKLESFEAEWNQAVQRFSQWRYA